MSNIALYKTYLEDYLEKYHSVTNPKRFFQCLNPNHTDNHPSMMFTNKYNICKCFACGASYDIFDLVGMDFKIDNFRDKIKKIEEIYLGYTPTYKEYKPTDNTKYDYTNYYNKCIRSIDKTNYLEQRGISKELMKKYKIGFDEERNLIVFPINKHCYFARSTINKDKIKSRGSSDIWNKDLLNNSSDVIYVTEGIIDSLSLEEIDPNIKTLSINGVGNINSLVYAVKNNNFKGTIIIAFDNDYAGREAGKKLKEELAKINVNSFSISLVANFDSDKCKDVNEALIINRELLENNYKYFDENLRKVIEHQKQKNNDELQI